MFNKMLNTVGHLTGMTFHALFNDVTVLAVLVAAAIASWSTAVIGLVEL